MRQYFRFKRKHPDCLLMFRMGDFYEMFDDDAVAASRALGLTLTERTAGVPMAGMPHHQLEPYVRRLIAQGFRVAVADQIQDPREAKGVVERAVTRVFTPGTLVDDELLAEGGATRLAAIAPGSGEGSHSLAAVDVSTGAFTLFACRQAELADALLRRAVGEVLFPDEHALREPIERAIEAAGASGTPRPGWQFRAGEAEEAVRGVFGVASLSGFGIDQGDPAIIAAGAIVRYLQETQTPGAGSGDGLHARASLIHLRPPVRERDEDACVLDATSLRALEVERTIRGGETAGSLLGIFAGKDGCRTAMGKRLLREWLRRPSGRLDTIQARQRCVSALVEDRTLASTLAGALGPVQDVSRIAARLALGRASPRDVAGLGDSLSRLDALRDAVDGTPAFVEQHSRLGEIREDLSPLAERISSTCVERPPAHLREGGLVRDGVDAELDEARSLERDAGAWLAEYQAGLIAEHKLPNLKVGFNRVFGYYIELPAAQSVRAPDIFTRKQTLKNAERYITPELKEHESKVMSAQSRALERERRIFDELCAASVEQIPTIHRFADVVARLDALVCFADKASRRGWVRPEIVQRPVLDITAGRHPVLDELLGDGFVPNDVALGVEGDGSSAASVALITGPNMAGKSTFIRQSALLVLLAHAGSFIPAERAVIGLTDRIFTRVGADDALHSGQSTFMVEMTETASILNNATERSLIVLDEIGRGTSTLDGLSLAWAIVEYLAEATERRSDGATKGGEGKKRAGPRVLFATHYHELTELEERLPGRVKNLHVAVREWGDEIIFVHRIRPGRTDRSYGVHVAKLAGVPEAVTTRAREVLESLEVHHASPDASAVTAPASEQLALFTQPNPHPAVDELREVKLESITPMEAFDKLRRLKEMVEERE